MTSKSSLILTLAFALLAGCGGAVSLGETSEASQSTPPPVTPATPKRTPGTTTPGATLATLAARCAEAHGSRVQPRTPSSFHHALVGRWLACQYDPKSPSLLIAHQGIEITASGRYYLLEPDGLGGLQRATQVIVNNGGTPPDTYPVTIEPDGSYSIYSGAEHGLVGGDDDTPSTLLSLHLNEVILDLDVSFEASPREFLTNNGIAMWFVTADDELNDPTPRQPALGELCGPDDGQCRTGLDCALVFPPAAPGVSAQGVCTVPK